MGEDEYVLIIVDENHVSTLYSSFVIFYHKEDLGLKFPKIIVKREGERELDDAAVLKISSKFDKTSSNSVVF